MTTAIIFAGHRNDEVTNHHYDLMCRNNPDCTVLPVSDGDGEWGTNLSEDYCPLPVRPRISRPNWYFCDRLIHKTYYRYPNYDRYIYMEWDVCCTQSLQEAYSKAWDADIAGHKLKGLEDDWYWWRELQYTNKKTDLAGIAPLVGLLTSNKGMQAIWRHILHDPVFCELRMGTAIKRSGIAYQPIPKKLASTLKWDKYDGPIEKGVYHSVKHLTHTK